MINHSLGSWLNVSVPDLNTLAWKQTMRLTWVRRGEIVAQRPMNNSEDMKLRDFEARHFVSGWIGLAFRFRACAEHNQVFSASFQETRGDPQHVALYQEDEALFGFFVNGLSALECFCYSLYALGALVRTPTQTPSTPPQPLFPLLDPHNPKKLRAIKPGETLRVFQRHFSGHALTTQLDQMLGDPAYQEWSDIRNVAAHRAATAGRSFQYTDPDALLDGNHVQPAAIMLWAGDILLATDTTSSRYQWLRETLNAGIEATLEFAKREIPYPEAQLPPL